ncbi:MULTISPECIES: hypothetical protein [unclassified Pseudomonas]|uniref:hypothetical protein n=1 Tax=unclassified Pseudomonas TaxID=196821 RepID=UPI000BA32CE8|nr:MULTISPECIES: hypothetical protein [unclassified Pseudomonas]
MIHSNRWLYVLIFFLVLAHAVYFVLERHHLSGSYFSHGIVLLESGESLPQSSRLQFQKNTIYDFQQVDGSSSLLPLKVNDSIRSSFFLTTTSQNQSLNKMLAKYASSQLAYNQAYYAKENMPLTLYRLPTDTNNFCAYIVELQKLRCFGVAH